MTSGLCWNAVYKLAIVSGCSFKSIYFLTKKPSKALCFKGDVLVLLPLELMYICDRILENWPCRANFCLQLWSKITNQLKFSRFLDYCFMTNYYPLPTFWHKSDARACCCCCTRSIYFRPLDRPSIAYAGGVVTWRQCYKTTTKINTLSINRNQHSKQQYSKQQTNVQLF